ncbi:hypothetical protein Rs2_45156 [Raphanus sativus]|nr:hypothetical protein Rs2_45156 [Raphanus sativus]
MIKPSKTVEREFVAVIGNLGPASGRRVSARSVVGALSLSIREAEASNAPLPSVLFPRWGGFVSSDIVGLVAGDRSAPLDLFGARGGSLVFLGSRFSALGLCAREVTGVDLFGCVLDWIDEAI